jgi:hypothetical protein
MMVESAGREKARRTTGTKKVPAANVAGKTPAQKKRATGTTDVTAAERERMIREAAYFRAAQRGFTGGDPLGDWLDAESDIDAQLSPQRARAKPAKRAAADDHQQTLKERLDQANEQLERLRARAGRLKQDARAEWEHELARLHELRDTLEQQAQELKNKTRSRSEALRTQAEQAWKDFKAGIDRIRHRFEL